MTKTTSSPLVAIVTPVYNGGRFLAETMECVQAQTYPHIVHYVLDNASTNSTSDIIGRFKDRRIPVITARNESTLPMLDNWNAAVRLVRRGASYFRILPADDLISPQGIEKMVAAGEQHPEVEIIGCQEWSGGVLFGTDLPPDQRLFDGRAVVRGSLLNDIHGFPHLHCLYRVPQDGLQDPFYETEFYGVQLMSVDMDVAMRALSHGRYAYVHEPLVTTRLHEHSVTSVQVIPNHVKMWSELQLIDRWGPTAFDSYADFLKCRNRHLHFYYRYMLLWRFQRKLKLFEQHREWLRRASAEPTAGGYFQAVLEWPLRRVLKGLRRSGMRQRLLVPQQLGAQ